MKDHAHSQSVQGLSESVLDKKYRFPLTLAILLAFFNQFSGINAFLYYAPRIFEAAGLGASTALLSGIGVGVVNLIFTLIGINLIDRLGRKTLMYWGVLWLYHLPGPSRPGLCRIMGWSLGTHFSFSLYSIARHWTRHGDLGLHFRGISQPLAQQWTSLGYFYPLGIGRDYPLHGPCFVHLDWSSPSIWIFCLDDGASTRLCALDDARN